MTKQTTATLTPAQAQAPAKPFSINVAAPCHLAFAESVVHARNGYCFSEAPISIQPNGWAFFQMIQGSPDVQAIQAAKESVNLSVEQEAAQFRKAVAEEAKRQIEAAKRASLEAEVAAAVAAHEKQIAAMKRATEAELARL